MRERILHDFQLKLMKESFLAKNPVELKIMLDASAPKSSSFLKKLERFLHVRGSPLEERPVRISGILMWEFVPESYE